MGRFRFSIGWLMIVVAVLALDFGAARACLRSDPIPNFDVVFFFGLPMLNILGIGFVIGRSRQGRARAFWTGFNRFGCLAVAALALDILVDRHRTVDWYMDFLEPLLEAINRSLESIGSEHWDENSPGFWLVVVPLLFSVTVPPLLLPALVGGWILSRLSMNHMPHPSKLPEGQTVE